MAKVFVGGLAWATTSDSLRSRFEEFGKVVSATVVEDRETGRSRGFGFVEFEEEKDAETCCQEMKDQELDGRTIRVDMANNRPPRRDRDSRDSYRGDRGDRGDRDRGDFRRDRSPRGYRRDRSPRERRYERRERDSRSPSRH